MLYSVILVALAVAVAAHTKAVAFFGDVDGNMTGLGINLNTATKGPLNVVRTCLQLHRARTSWLAGTVLES